MFRKRALIYYDNDGGTIHVSGHASQEEQKMLLNLVRPRYFIPIHGEYRQLFRHSALAHAVGAVSEEIMLIEDGQPIEFTEDRAYRREPVTAGRALVDSGLLEEIDEVVIRDRKHLSEDGVVMPIIAINKHTGQIERSPKSSRVDSCPPMNKLQQLLKGLVNPLHFLTNELVLSNLPVSMQTLKCCFCL